MKDLAIKTNKFIEKETPEMKKKVYPKVDIPLSFVEDEDVDIDDKVELKFKSKVVGLENTEYRKIVTFELIEGEMTHKKGKKSLVG